MSYELLLGSPKQQRDRLKQKLLPFCAAVAEPQDFANQLMKDDLDMLDSLPESYIRELVMLSLNVKPKQNRSAVSFKAFALKFDALDEKTKKVVTECAITL